MPQVFPDTISLNLPKTGCDSHAHLVYSGMLEDLDPIMQRAEETGIAHIGQIFLSPQSYYDTRHLFDKYPNVFFTIAIHPNDINKRFTADTIAELKSIIQNDNRFKAVGETGLDYFKSEVPKDEQENAFRKQLELARELNLPVVIHSREAFYETIQVLDDMNFQNYPLVWHCFCSNKEHIDAIISRGWYISVSGAITYPANKEARADLKYIPKDKLLVETDCPFLSPQGWRGERNEPCLTAISAKVIAEHREEDLAELWTQCGENAKKVFRLV